ncbi:MAG TPA: hypothetical protein P5519_08145 [Spirochaetia bacterium]|nr:hypothetical protein [Spirochaetia bacterium]
MGPLIEKPGTFLPVLSDPTKPGTLWPSATWDPETWKPGALYWETWHRSRSPDSKPGTIPADIAD